MEITITSNSIPRQFEIFENEGHFAIKQNGELIAILEYWEDWEQTSGEPLDEDVFQKLVDKIEDHYE